MRILEELVKMGKLSDLQMRAIIAAGLDENDENAMSEALAASNIDRSDILQAKSNYYNLPILNVSSVPQPLMFKLDKDFMANCKVLPVSIDNSTITLAMVNPELNDAMDKAKLEMLRLGNPYKFGLIDNETFDKIYKEYNNSESLLQAGVQAQEIADKEAQQQEVADVTEKIKKAQEEAVKITQETEGITMAGLINKALSSNDSAQTTVEENKKAREEILSEEDILDISQNDGNLERLKQDGDGSAVDEINTILKYSIDGGASDIHIEHAGEYTRVRVRMDGELKEIAAFGKAVHPMIVARVKILSSLRLDEKRKPQDGRFSVLLNSHKIDFRVSTMPGYYGEKIVMRILDSYRGIRKLEDIGFSARHLEQIREALHKPYGMVLISGPTGSGKTTTLYSMLNEIDRKSKNVVSLEDPIEYNVPSMNQSQVFPEIGYTFASGLRSILRQDPDVIMVGEIRDAETAQLAVQAALTGHLVFSTIHTNNSVGVITRLIDMNVDPFLIAPTLNLAIAQRLARKIIDGAQEPILDNPGIEKMIDNQFQDLPDEYKNILDLKRPLNNAKATADNPTGMKGRVPVLEILEIDKDIQRGIIDRKTEEEIWKMARSKGMINMKEDAIMKSMQGLIPFVEINNL